MVTPWDLITSGQILEGVIASYTNVMGAEMFYVLVAFIGFTLIYMRTRNFGTTIITGLLVGGALFATFQAKLPQVELLAYLLMALGAAIIISQIFKSI